MRSLLLLILVFLFPVSIGLTGCASAPPPSPPIESRSMLEENLEKFAEQQKDDIAGGQLPKVALTPKLLYQILAADMASQRKKDDQGVVEWMNIAEQTQDARAAKHAALIAFRAKNFAVMEKAAILWSNLAPDSWAAHRLLVIALLQNKKISSIVPHVQMLLKAKPQEAPAFFVQLPVLLGLEFNKDEMVSTTKALTEPYIFLPEAKLALAYAQHLNGEKEQALQLLDEALRQKPNFQAAISVREAIVKGPIANTLPFPMTPQEALIKARLLLQAGNTEQAEKIYVMLLKEYSGNVDVLYGLALLRWQQADLVQAKTLFLEIESQSSAYLDEVRFYLGQIAEQENDLMLAQKWFKKGLAGALKTESKQALILVLAKTNQIKEALKQLAHLAEKTEAEKIKKIQLHAQIYSVNEANEKAKQVLTQGLQKFPVSAELFYDRGIVFDKLGKKQKSEADLRKALSLQPDNSVFLNGLGFLLIEHNKNLSEASELLEKAQKISPNNPYIEDSIGWLWYRQGKLAQAEEKLRSVFFTYKDPEVIAHLVEILWVQKKYEEAKAILALGLKLYPHSQVLSNLRKRLNIS